MFGQSPLGSSPFGTFIQDGGTSATIYGTLSATLDAATLGSSGSISINGQESQTLDALTVLASASVSVNSTLNSVLNDLTATSSGTVGASGINGSLSCTLSEVSSSGTIAREPSASWVRGGGWKPVGISHQITPAISATANATLGNMFCAATAELGAVNVKKFIRPATIRRREESFLLAA